MKILFATAFIVFSGFAFGQTLQNSNYSSIGHVSSDGTVQDKNYSTIGHASGVRREWIAACYFFFSFDSIRLNY